MILICDFFFLKLLLSKEKRHLLVFMVCKSNILKFFGLRTILYT